MFPSDIYIKAAAATATAAVTSKFIGVKAKDTHVTVEHKGTTKASQECKRGEEEKEEEENRSKQQPIIWWLKRWVVLMMTMMKKKNCTVSTVEYWNTTAYKLLYLILIKSLFTLSLPS